MAKIGEYQIGNIYSGGTSPFNSSYGSIFTGYNVSAGQFGMSIDPRTANILQEASSKLSSGVKHIELTPISPEVLESVPKQHFKEMNRLAKLTGIDVTLHGPLVEASGFTKEGYSEENRKAAERQILNAIERSHEMNPTGSSPTTFHSTVLLPGFIQDKTRKQPGEIFVINQENNSINRLPLKQRVWKGEEEPNADVEINKINESSWKDNLNNLAYKTHWGIRSIEGSAPLALHSLGKGEKWENLDERRKEARSNFNYGISSIESSYKEFKNLFETAIKYGKDDDKKELNQFINNIQGKIETINKNPKDVDNVYLKQAIVEQGLELLNKLNPPEIFKPLQKFALEQSSQTFGNAAFESFKKVKEGKWEAAPIISIENPPAGTEFSTGEQLKALVEASRKQFVDKAMKPKAQEGLGLSKSEAEKEAEKLIGVTWDVGHINMLRKYGYKSEDIAKETEKVAPLVKHVHLSDNFGFEHTELPMGMGNVPMKEIIEKLGKEGFQDVRKIIEAGNWWQHFKSPPVRETLEAFGSQFYVDGVSGPAWSGAGALEQGYFFGYGQMLPQTNYEMFGAGFANLPVELGGVRRTAEGSRMSGRGME